MGKQYGRDQRKKAATQTTMRSNRKGKQKGRDQRRKAGTKTRVRSKGKASSTEGIKEGKLAHRPR